MRQSSIKVQRAGATAHEVRQYARRAAFAASVCGALSLALAGCGITSLTSGLGSGIFGGSKKAEPVVSVSETDLLSAAKQDSGTGSTGGVSLAGNAGTCPKFLTRPEVRTITVYEPGQEGDGLAIIHRGEITKTARECRVGPNQITIRYGYSGRVLLGPRGKAGTFLLPVTVKVTDFKRETVQGQQHQVAVTIPENRPIGYFSKVDQVTFEIPEGVRAADFQLVVGFEAPAKQS